MQGVVDDVLGEVEARVENVVAGDPAGLDAVRRGGALLADGVCLEAFEMFGAKHAAATCR